MTATTAAHDDRRPVEAADSDDVAAAAFALASVMTLVMLLLRTPAESTIWLTVLVVGGVLARPYTADTRWYWVVLFAVFLVSPISRPWLALDNHHFLLIYWLAALALTRFHSRPDQSLQTVARLMIGLAFVFAVTWKFLAPGFLDGSFFEYTFGTDSRLGDVAVSLGLLEDGTVQENRRTISSWRRAGTEPSAGTLTVSGAISAISAPLAWGTVLIEASVAITFLAPLPERWRWLRDTTLMVFVVATYPLAPVLGFGWLLLCMGAMQSELSTRRRTLLYASVFAGLILIDERSYLLDLLQGVF